MQPEMRGADYARLVGLAAIWGASFMFMRVAPPALGPAVLQQLGGRGPAAAWRVEVADDDARSAAHAKTFRVVPLGGAEPCIGAVVYRDDDHLTATFSRNEAPVLGARIVAAVTSLQRR